MSTPPTRRTRGLGLVLVAAYGLLALAATGRSVYQILSEFDKAPLAYSLTALAAVVYILATIALVAPGQVWYRIAWITITFELLFVLTVGTLTIFDAGLFPEKTVWSFYGRGYAFVPLLLPVLGLIWLSRRRPVALAPAAA